MRALVPAPAGDATPADARCAARLQTALVRGIVRLASEPASAAKEIAATVVKAVKKVTKDRQQHVTKEGELAKQKAKKKAREEKQRKKEGKKKQKGGPQQKKKGKKSSGPPPPPGGRRRTKQAAKRDLARHDRHEREAAAADRKRQRQDDGEWAGVRRAPKKRQRTDLCRQFLRGRCSYGRRCRFSHASSRW